MSTRLQMVEVGPLLIEPKGETLEGECCSLCRVLLAFHEFHLSTIVQGAMAEAIEV